MSGLERREFLAYFEGAAKGYAIRLHEVAALPRPVTLSTLRRAAPGFAPPQSYHYLRSARARDRRLAACL